jgi:antitoxin VapB
MAEEIRARTFKSGNSLAIRLPKALGFREGDDIILTDHGDGTFTFRLAEPQAAALDGLYGSFSDSFMRDGRGDIEQSERDWDRDGQDRSRAA